MIVKPKKITSLFTMFFFLITQSVYALPTGEVVISGDVTFEQVDENTLNITASDNAIINYDSFNIAQDEFVNFLMPDLDAFVLNKITGGGTSSILGSLTANGNLIFVNGDGFHFGSMASIDVGGIIASTHDISNANFLAGNYNFQGLGDSIDESMSSILNEGSILTREGGMAILIADAIENRGTIEAPLGTVALAAGDMVTVGISGDGMISIAIDEGTAHTILDKDGNAITEQIKNSGTIAADSGKVTLGAKAMDQIFESAINLEGVVQANEMVIGADGTIEIVASGDVISTGTIEADTGTVLLEAEGNIESLGVLRTDQLVESGAAFRVGGVYDVGLARVVNADNAITLSTGDYTGETRDPGDIIVDTSAVVTLIGDTTFYADCAIADCAHDGNGQFTMNAGSSIVGGGFDLTIYSSESGDLRSITGVDNFNLNESNAASNPTYTANNDIDVDGQFNLNTGSFTAPTNLNVAGNMTIGAGATFTHNSGTVIFDGTTQLTSNGEIFNHIHVGGSSPGAGGSLDTLDDLDINGNLTVNNSGATTLNFANDSVFIAGNLDLTNLDTGVFGGSTINFDGDSFLTSNGYSLNNINIGTASAGGDVDLLDDLTMTGSIAVGTAASTVFNVAGDTVNIEGDMILTNLDTYIGGSGANFVFNGTGTNSLDTAGTTIDGVTVDGTSKTLQLTGGLTTSALTIGADDTFFLNGNAFTFSSAAAVTNNGTFRLQGNETLTSVNNLGNAAGTVEYVGNGDATDSDVFTIKNFTGTDYYNLTLNSTDANDIFRTAAASPLTVAGAFTGTNGTFDNATNDNAITVTGDVTFDNDQVQMGTATWTVGGNWDHKDLATLNQNSSTLVLTGVGKTINSSGLSSVQELSSLTIQAGASYTLLAGSNDLEALRDVIIDGSLSISTGRVFRSGVISSTSTSVGAAGQITGDGMLKVYRNFSLAAGGTVDVATTNWIPGSAGFTLTPNEVYDSALFIIGNDAVTDRIARLSAGTYTFNNFQLQTEAAGSRTLDLATNNPNLIIQGSVSMDAIGGAVAWTKGNGTITLSGAGSGTQTFDFNDFNIEDLIINDAGATKQLTDGLTTDALTVTAGTLDMNGQAFDFATSQEAVNNATIQLLGSETFGANVQNLDIDTGTVVYAGDGGSGDTTHDIHDFGATDYFNLTLNSTDSNDTFRTKASSPLTVAGAFTGTNGTFDNATNDNAITVTGDVTMDNDQIDAGDATWTIAGNTDLTDVTVFNRDASTFSLTGTSKTFAGTGGGWDDRLNILSIENGATISTTNGFALLNLNVAGTLTLGANQTTQLDTTVTSTGTLSGSGRTYSARSGFSQMDGTVDVSSLVIGTSTGNSVLAAGTYDSASLEITSHSTGNSTFEILGAVVFNGDVLFDSDGTSGLVLNNNTNNPNMTFNGNVTVDETDTAMTWNKGAGTITLGAGGAVTDTIDFNDVSVEDIVVNDSDGGLKQLTDGLTTESLTVTNGTLDMNGQAFDFATSQEAVNNATIQLLGSETFGANVQNLDIDTGTVVYAGDGGSGDTTHDIHDFGATDYFNLTLNSTDSNDTFRTKASSPLTVAGAFTGTNGTFDNATNDNAITVTGDVTMDNDQVDMGDATWTVSGNWDHKDVTTFNDDLSTLVMNGTGKTITAHNNKALRNLTIASGATITLSSNTDAFATIHRVLDVQGTLTLDDHLYVIHNGGVNNDVKVGATGVINGTGNLFATNISQMDGSISNNQLVISSYYADNLIVPAQYDSATVTFQGANPANSRAFSATQAGTFVFTNDVVFESRYAGETYTINNSAFDNSYDFRGNVSVTESNGGTLAWTKGTGTITLGNNASDGTQTINFLGTSIEDLVVNGTGDTKQLTGSLTTESFALQNGTFQLNGNTLTVDGGNLTVSGGDFQGGTGTINLDDGDFSQTNGIFTTPSGGFTMEKNFTVSAGTFNNANTLTFDATTSGSDSLITYSGVLPGTVAFNKAVGGASATVAAGTTISLGAAPSTAFDTLTVNGAVTVDSGTWTVAGETGNNGIINNGTITHSGSGWDINDASLINNASGTITYAGTTLNIDDDFTQLGAFNLTGKTISFDYASSGSDSVVTASGALGGTVVFNKDTSGASMTVAAGTIIDLGADPNSDLKGGLINNGQINIASGTWTADDNGSDGNIVNNGTIDHDGDGWVITDMGLINNTGATITYEGTALSVERDYTHDGTFDLTGKTLTLNGTQNTDISTLSGTQNIQGNVVINNTHDTAATTLGSNVTIEGNFTRTDGEFTNPGSAYSLNVQGDVQIDTTHTFGGANLTLGLTGGNNQTVTQNAGTITGPMQVNKSGNTATMATALTTGSTLDIVEGNFDLDGQTLTAGSTFTVQDGGNFIIHGDESYTSPTLASGSTLTYKGNGDSNDSDVFNIVDYGASDYHHLVINSTDNNDIFRVGANPLNLGGNLTVTNGTFDNTTNDQAITIAGDVALDGDQVDMGAATWTVSGNWDHQDVTTFNRDTSTLVMDGTNKTMLGNNSNLLYRVTIDGSVELLAGTTTEQDIRDLTVNGTFTLSERANVGVSLVVGGSGRITGTDELTLNVGDITQMDGTIDVATMNIQGGTMVAAQYDSATVNFGDINASFDMTFGAGNHIFAGDVNFIKTNTGRVMVVQNDVNNPNLEFRGDVLVNEANGGVVTWDAGTGTITLGGGNSNINFLGKTVEDIVVNSTGQKTFTGAVTTDTNLTVQAGTAFLNAAMNVPGTLQIDAGGTFNRNGQTLTFGTLVNNGTLIGVNQGGNGPPPGPKHFLKHPNFGPRVFNAAVRAIDTMNFEVPTGDLGGGFDFSPAGGEMSFGGPASDGNSFFFGDTNNSPSMTTSSMLLGLVNPVGFDE